MAQARLGPREVSNRVQAVRRLALASPASNGIGARLDLRRDQRLIAAVVQAGAVDVSGNFALSDAGFAAALNFIRKATSDRPVFSAQTVQNEHAMHSALPAKAVNKQSEVGQPGHPGGDTSYYQKQIGRAHV